MLLSSSTWRIKLLSWTRERSLHRVLTTSCVSILICSKSKVFTLVTKMKSRTQTKVLCCSHSSSSTKISQVNIRLKTSTLIQVQMMVKANRRYFSMTRKSHKSLSHLLERLLDLIRRLTKLLENFLLMR